MNPKLIPILGINIVSWGLFGLMSKFASQRLHPLQMFIIGSSMGLLTLPVYYGLFRASNVSTPITLAGVLYCIAGSLCSTFGNIAFVYGIKTGDLGTVAVLSSAYPILTVILAVIFLGESLTLVKIAGILLVIAGVMILGR